MLLSRDGGKEIYINPTLRLMGCARDVRFHLDIAMTRYSLQKGRVSLLRNTYDVSKGWT